MNPAHLTQTNVFLCPQVICVVFVCAAFTLDIFCLIFVPLHWLFFVASTYVLFNYIWHTGECEDHSICFETENANLCSAPMNLALFIRDMQLFSELLNM